MLRKLIPDEETAAEDFKDDIYISHLRPRCSPIGLTREVLIFNDTDKHLLLWPSSHYRGSFYKATAKTEISPAKMFSVEMKKDWVLLPRGTCFRMSGWLHCWDIHLWRINSCYNKLHLIYRRTASSRFLRKTKMTLSRVPYIHSILMSIKPDITQWSLYLEE